MKSINYHNCATAAVAIGDFLSNMLTATRRTLARAARSAGIAIALAIATVSAPPVFSQAPHPWDATWSYTAKAGDTLIDIADRYLNDKEDWHEIAKLNRVPDPHHLQPGSVLKLPVALMKRELLPARVVAANGPVEHALRGGPFKPVTSNATLGEGNLRTGHSGFVTLEFADGTHLFVLPDSVIELGTLRKSVFTGATERVIDLRRGEVDNQVTHSTDEDSRFEIHSPSVVAAVRGTRFRVNYQHATTTVAVLEGIVAVRPANAPPGAAEQFVRAGFGSITHDGGKVGAPLELLPAPELVDPAKVQDEADVVFDLVPLPGAHGYRVQIANDAELADPIRDLQIAATHAMVGPIADSIYFVRIAAIDGTGMEGSSRTYAFERRLNLLTAAADRRAGGRDYEFRWRASREGVVTRYRFMLARTKDFSDPIVDQVDLRAERVTVSSLVAGTYYWTVIAEQFENGRLYEKASGIRSFMLSN